MSKIARMSKTRELLRSGGATVYDIAAELGVTIRSAARYIDALERLGEPVWSEREGGRGGGRTRFFIGYSAVDFLDRAAVAEVRHG